MKRSIMIIMAIAITFTLWVSFTVDKNIDDWEVPAKYEKMKNPYIDAVDNDLIGKTIYVKHCKSCHGKKGAGDGTKAEELETPMPGFATEAFQAQSDGALYYKTVFGRDEMPSYEKKIAEMEDRWLLVNYLRTLK